MPLMRIGKRSGKYSLSRDLYVLSIQLMEESRVLQCTLSTDSTGSDCMEYICQKLEFKQGCYFGLRFKCAKLKYRWVEMDKPLRKQLEKYAQEQRLYFAVMYHTPNANLLTDEVARYYYFLQMKSDIIEGRLVISPEKAILLASYCLQVELGDHDEMTHTVDFLKGFPLLPKHMTKSAQIMEDLLRQVLIGHKSLLGVPPAEAELYYITEIQQCDGYGEDFFQCKDEEGSETWVGYSQDGIVVKRVQGAPLKYRWEEIFKIASQKRNLLIKCAELSSIHFTMEDAEMARYVAVIFSFQLEFFRMFLWKAKSLQRLPSGAGDLQWKYRPGPYRSELVQNGHMPSGPIPISVPQFIQPEPSSSPQPDQINGYGDQNGDVDHMLHQRLSQSTPHMLITNNEVTQSQLNVNANLSNQPSTSALTSRDVLPTVAPQPATIGAGYQSRASIVPPPYKPAPDYQTALTQPTVDPALLTFVGSNQNIDRIIANGSRDFQNQRITNEINATLFCHSTPDLTLSALESIVSRPATAYDTRQERATTVIPSGLYGPSVFVDSLPKLNQIVNQMQISEDNLSELKENITSVVIGSSGGSQELDDTDAAGRRDRSVSLPPPHLKTSVSEQPLGLKHEGPRPNTTLNGVILNRPDLLQGSEASAVSNDERLALMESRLQEGRLTEEFDRIPRKRVSAGVSTAQKPDNYKRNRYNNVLPYEDTRVMLRPNKHNPLGYINASNIQIPLGDVLLKYIATQAPFKETCQDFWQMIWESGAQIIVMLTKCLENKKEQSSCYWPTRTGKSGRVKFGDYQVSLQSRTETQTQVTSCLSVKHSPSSQRRIVYHLQFFDWPTGEVPENVDKFLGFLDEVNSVKRHLENEMMRNEENRQSSSISSGSPAHRQRSKSAHGKLMTGAYQSRAMTKSYNYMASISKFKKIPTHFFETLEERISSFLPDISIVRHSPNNSGRDKLFTQRLDVLPNSKDDWMATDEAPPIVVHCCSGIGRTGTYILVELMIYCLEHNHNCDVPTVLKMLRQQRMLLIQTPLQYKFVYTCLVDYLRNSRLI